MPVNESDTLLGYDYDLVGKNVELTYDTEECRWLVIEVNAHPLD